MKIVNPHRSNGQLVIVVIDTFGIHEDTYYKHTVRETDREGHSIDDQLVNYRLQPSYTVRMKSP